MTEANLGNHVVHIPSGNENNPAVYNPGTWSGAGSCGALTVSPGTGKPCSGTGNTNQRRVTALANPNAGAYYSEVSIMYDGSSSVYDGLLVTVQHRFSNNFTLLSNYTWSKSSPVAQTWATWVQHLPESRQPGRRTQQLRRRPAQQLRHFDGCQERCQRRADEVGNLGRWQIAPIIFVTSGTRVSPTTGSDASLTGVLVDRPNLSGDPYVHGQPRKFWLNTASFAKNTAGNYGNTRPYTLVGPTYADLNLAGTRFIPLHESAQLAFRTECFNCLNHPSLLGPVAAMNSSVFG
ncbi:MAG TPA: hypothetical protein VGT08_16880 [Terracidiphilus sp.]|nr:hypothetical protein [Terracidiphilus sp.]